MMRHLSRTVPMSRLVRSDSASVPLSRFYAAGQSKSLRDNLFVCPGFRLSRNARRDSLSCCQCVTWTVPVAKSTAGQSKSLLGKGFVCPGFSPYYVGQCRSGTLPRMRGLYGTRPSVGCSPTAIARALHGSTVNRIRHNHGTRHRKPLCDNGPRARRRFLIHCACPMGSV